MHTKDGRHMPLCISLAGTEVLFDAAVPGVTEQAVASAVSWDDSQNQAFIRWCGMEA